MTRAWGWMAECLATQNIYTCFRLVPESMTLDDLEGR